MFVWRSRLIVPGRRTETQRGAIEGIFFVSPSGTQLGRDVARGEGFPAQQHNRERAGGDGLDGQCGSRGRTRGTSWGTRRARGQKGDRRPTQGGERVSVISSRPHNEHFISVEANSIKLIIIPVFSTYSRIRWI